MTEAPGTLSWSCRAARARSATSRHWRSLRNFSTQCSTWTKQAGPGNTPQEAVTFRAATAYIEAASKLGKATPYVIQIGGGVTLYRDGVRIMDAFPPGTERYALAQGHWLAMEAYQHSAGFEWTVMSANTGSIQEQGQYTGRFRLGNQEELVDRNGGTYISRQDFAIAVIDMAESRTVTGKRVAVGPPY